jgi:glycosyltransferase involved in cell wall biosynthesis
LNSNKKVLIIDFTNFFGGGQKFIKNLQILLGKDLHFSFAVSNKKLIDLLEHEEILKISSNYIYILYEIFKINKYIKKNNFKYVILNGNRPIYFSFLFSSKVKKIAYKHTSSNAYTNPFKKIFITIVLNFNYLFCYRVVVLYKKAINEIVLSKNKVRIISNPILLENRVFNYNKTYIKDKISLLVITRIDEDKGLDWLIDSFARLNKITSKTIELKIAGDGPFMKQLEKKINTLNLNNVCLLGFVEDVSLLLNNSDIFLLTSKFESFPLSILEALSFGLPVIATNTGGIYEMVQNNKNGYLIDFNNDNQLLNSMCDLISDTQKRLLFGKVSSDLYQEKYTNDVFKINFFKYLID